jgi:hypothetical protein
LKWSPAGNVEKWVPITCSAGTFDVQVRRPDFRERNFWYALRSSEGAGRSKSDALADANAYCVDTSVVAWRGLQDQDGKDIPFDVQTLHALCQAYPDAHNGILIVGIDAFTKAEAPADPPGDPGGN